MEPLPTWAWFIFIVVFAALFLGIATWGTGRASKGARMVFKETPWSFVAFLLAIFTFVGVGLMFLQSSGSWEITWLNKPERIFTDGNTYIWSVMFSNRGDSSDVSGSLSLYVDGQLISQTAVRDADWDLDKSYTRQVSWVSKEYTEGTRIKVEAIIHSEDKVYIKSVKEYEVIE